VIELRDALPHEYDAVGDLTYDAYVGDGHIEAGSDYSRKLRDTALRAKEAEVVVAVEDGVLLGSVTNCPPGSPWKELSGDGWGEFRLLAVAAPARGRGVGEALVRECLARSRAADDIGMALSTKTSMAAAHRMYHRLGFLRSPEEDWRPLPHIELWAFRMTYA
jgi:GNAT superfamily N-acetyltransferase